VVFVSSDSDGTSLDEDSVGDTWLEEVGVEFDVVVALEVSAVVGVPDVVVA
jgi:hypothetical protein